MNININRKTRKNKKGFTLIELIVVIAILGILAIIAVPRLAGFRNSVQISADERTEETIGKSVNVAVASSRLQTGTVIATPNATTGVITWTGTATAPGTGNTITSVMQDLLGTDVRFQRTGATAVTWTIAASGDVTR
jgi:type IV pilus assembly protein PilA